jgi:hypothetical protein
VSARFQIQSGVGLDRFDSRNQLGLASGGGTQGFCEFDWIVNAGLDPGRQPANNKFATQILGPVLSDAAGATSRQAIDRIPAQSVNVSVDVDINAQNADVTGQTYIMEFSAFLAPRTHIRPDWYQVDGEPFAGGETGGR